MQAKSWHGFMKSRKTVRGNGVFNFSTVLRKSYKPCRFRRSRATAVQVLMSIMAPPRPPGEPWSAWASRRRAPSARRPPQTTRAAPWRSGRPSRPNAPARYFTISTVPPRSPWKQPMSSQQSFRLRTRGTPARSVARRSGSGAVRRGPRAARAPRRARGRERRREAAARRAGGSTAWRTGGSSA